ncbi:PIG-L deacetylase family protein [Allorhizocola rhizosphaerae]|uniref:PIG-L deacetylase family protein n=1 Tax=Allorhizocola rhizosphaerae TaxID=1872709 RepID=UPI0013C3614D|nr:PIG-L deacetylase family protein [Allorhizocola rhizosphaerae]
MAVCVILTGVFALAAVAVPGRLRGRIPGLWAIHVCLWSGLGANLWCLFTGNHDQTPAGLAVTASSVLVLGGVGGIAAVTPARPVPVRAARRVLVVGAHPDDLELACGATVAKLADSGHEIFALVLTRGGNGGSAEERAREAVAAGRLLGVSQVRVLDLPDTRLAAHEPEAVAAIEAVVRRFNPDIIFTHSANDQHADHRAAHVATLQAARSHSAILCYESPSVTTDFDPRVFVDVEDYVDLKIAAVGAHADQRGKAYMSAERVRGIALFRGAQAKVRLAEGFEPVRLLRATPGEL